MIYYEQNLYPKRGFGDVILLVIPCRKREELRSLPSELLKNKIVFDATNPYSENFELIDLGNSTSSEEVAKELHGARIVLFVAGDAAAKDVVSKLIEDIGFKAVDRGSLIYNNPMTVEVAYKRLAELDKHDNTWPHRD